MKKTILILTLIIIVLLLTGCGHVTNLMGNRFKTIEEDGYTTLCYDKDTDAVYIVFMCGNNYGISPYIMFDKTDHPTIGKWNGEKIVPAR